MYSQSVEEILGDTRIYYGSHAWANNLLRYCIRFIGGHEFRTHPGNGIIFLRNNQQSLVNHGFKYQARILGFWISKYIQASFTTPSGVATPSRGEEESS